MRIPDRTSEPLRRIHSLAGMIPLGVFLVEHILVNAMALGGPESFRRVAAALGGIPMVAAIEILGIALPLVVHVVLGILIATELPERGSREWPTRREIVQRVTGLLLLPYLIYHVWSTRLSPDVLVKHGDLYEIMSRQVSGAGGLAFHAIGVALAAWHLGNGIPGFAERWSLARTPGAARAVARAGATLSAALGVLGVAALVAFSNAPAADPATQAGFESEAAPEAAQPPPHLEPEPAHDPVPAGPTAPSDTGGPETSAPASTQSASGAAGGTATRASFARANGAPASTSAAPGAPPGGSP